MDDEAVDSGSTSRQEVRIAALVGLIIGIVVTALSFATATLPSEGEWKPGLSPLYKDNATRTDVVMVRGDGQIYASFAQDPLLQDRDMVLANRPAYSYFATRPLLSALAWALSLGQAPLVPGAMILVVVASSSAAAAGAVRLLQLCYPAKRAMAGLLIFFLPGTVVSIVWIEPNVLGLALVFWAFVFWFHSPRAPVLAIGLFVLATLTRETMLLVPAALVAHSLLVQRVKLRSLLPFLFCPASYLLWVTIVRVRTGYGPERFISLGGVVSPPFVGLFTGLQRWELTEWLVAVMFVAFILVLVVAHRREVFAWVAFAFALSSVTSGVFVWETWTGFGRAYLPLFAFALLVVLPDRPSSQRRSATSTAAVANP